MNLQIEFGKRLKRIRESLGLSQEEFAEQIGLHRNSLVRLELGKGFASSKTLEQIHDKFKIPYNEMFDFNEEVFKDSYRSIFTKLEEFNDADIEYFLTTINAYIKAKMQN